MRGVFLVTVLAILVGLCGPAKALLDESQYTETEKIGFAFHSLGHITPDYESWIRNTEIYIKAKPAEKIHMLREGSTRLHRGFLNYGLDEDLIRLQANVLIRLPVNPAENKAAGADKSKLKTVRVRLADHDEFFFPVQVGDYWIALIPEGLEGLMTITMPEDEYKKFTEHLGFSDNYRQEIPAILDLKLRPISADVSTPVEMNDMALWPMLMEIGNASLWNSKRSVFAWQHQAPWYVPEGQQELLDLFGQ